MEKYERLVYIQGDTIVNRGLEGLWGDKGSWPEYGLAVSSSGDESVCKRFCVVRPSNELYRALVEFGQSGVSDPNANSWQSAERCVAHIGGLFQ